MRWFRFAALGAVLATLAGCATDEASGPPLMATGLFADTSAKKLRPEGKDGPLISVANSGAEGATASSFAATESPALVAGSPAIKQVAFVGDREDAGREPANYRLNFENADLREVVQAVLGETLRLNFTMSEDVTGKVTISSPRPMTESELLSALEAALQNSGFTMTKTAAGYRIAPGSVGAGPVDTAFSTQPSYGLSVVPLRHVSAQTMGQLVSGFITETDGLRVDAARNAMIVRGPGAKRQEAVQAILSFDADWMQNQAVGVYETRRAEPQMVVTELNRIFDSEQRGNASGVIQFKPIGRLRAVMVVTKNPALMKRAEMWIKRLDRDTASGADNVFVYKAKYRDAKELARIITTLFRAGGDASRGAGGATTDQRGGQGQSGFATQSGFSNNSSGSSGASGSSSGFNSSNSSNSGSQSQQGGNSGGGQSAFNNPNFGDGTNNSDAAAGGGAAGGSGDEAAGGSIDLTSQEAGQNSKILVSADAANNAVVVYADGYTYQKVLGALRQLDSAPLQVAIEATIAEVVLTDNMKQGVEYFVKSKSIGLGNDKGSFSLFGATGNTLARQVPGFNFLLGSNSNPDVIISALDQVTNVDILSSPSLVVAENQPAAFQVGNEVPISTRQAQSVENVDAPILTQVEYRDTGVILNVTPRIGSNDAVTLKVEQEISAVSSEGGGDGLNPTFSKRRVASNITVTSGQTVLLAGLISKRDERGKNGIPLLSDLPAVGGLFSQRSRSKERTELVVFIRPKVIRTGEDAASVADEFRSKMISSRGAVRPVVAK